MQASADLGVSTSAVDYSAIVSGLDPKVCIQTVVFFVELFILPPPIPIFRIYVPEPYQACRGVRNSLNRDLF